MVKTFKQFSLNESKKFKNLSDAEGQYSILINQCTSDIIEYIKTDGDIIFSNPLSLYYLFNHKMHTENFVSIRVDGKDTKWGIRLGNENDEVLVGTTESGKEVPITVTTVPSNTFFLIIDRMVMEGLISDNY
jgi:hypothetical protein